MTICRGRRSAQTPPARTNDDEGQRLRGEDDAEGGRAPVERLDDGEGERDRDEAVAERRGRLPEPEQPELPLPQRSEELTARIALTLRDARARPTRPAGTSDAASRERVRDLVLQAPGCASPRTWLAGSDPVKTRAT